MSKLGNMPRIEIKYLVDIELLVNLTNSTLNHPIGHLSDIINDSYSHDNISYEKEGKKGFYLSGGSVDNNGEVSGCIMDGTYTLFDSKGYAGAVGNSFSKDDYTFDTEQSISISAKNSDTYIKHLVIYFDPKANEYATQLSFSSDSATTINKNSRLVYFKNFGEDSNLTSVKCSFTKWSKKNSLAKVLKIKTGFTGIYDYKTIKKFELSDEKVSNENKISFGVSSQYCDLTILDETGDVTTLFGADLLLENITAFFYIVNTETATAEDGTIHEFEHREKIGELIIDKKKNIEGSIKWTYNLIDRLEQLRSVICPALDVQKRTLYQIINQITSETGIANIVSWSTEAKKYCESVEIESSFIKPNQYMFDVLGKCCEVGLLKMFINPDGQLRIERGL